MEKCPVCGIDEIYSHEWGYSMEWKCLSGHFVRKATYDEIVKEWGDFIVQKK